MPRSKSKPKSKPVPRPANSDAWPVGASELARATPKDPATGRMPPLTDTDPMVGSMIYSVRVGAWVASDFDHFLAPLGVTLMQFNLLRILYRDPNNAGLPTGVLGQYLMTRVPDVPRLLDRLVKSELVERIPSPTDRRVVIVRLTQKGIDLIDNAMDGVLEYCRKRSAHMTKAELATLHTLLKKLYAGLPRDEG